MPHVANLELKSVNFVFPVAIGEEWVKKSVWMHELNDIGKW
jgi:hypothetical protein